MRRLLILRGINVGLREPGVASSQISGSRLGVLRTVPVGRTGQEAVNVVRGPVFAHLEAVAAEAIAHVGGVQNAVETHGA
jgi:hypothetical protein